MANNSNTLNNIEKEQVDNKVDLSGFFIKGTLIALLILTIYAFTRFDSKGVNYWEATIATLHNVKTMFLEMGLHHLDLAKALKNIGITFSLAFITTIFAAIISFFLSIAAAPNLSNPFLSTIVTAFVAFIRAVPTVLWVLIFAVSAGLGSEAAVIGLSFHAIGYLTKAYSEVFQEMDKGPIEALTSTGAGFWQIIFRAIVPSTITYLIAWTFMRFEINYMTAIAMGAAAGAGGIGFDLFMAGSFYFDTREVGAITVIILITVFILEMISVRLKKILNGE